MKTSELSGIGLDYAVAVAEGVMQNTKITKVWNFLDDYAPSVDWHRCGEIIENEKMGVWFCDAAVDESGNELREMYWYAEDKDGDHVQVGRTPREAAMRCFVASKLGDEVEIPEDLYEEANRKRREAG